jgi:hypothetical protein
MELQFKHRGGIKTTSSAIREAVDDAPDYYDGQLEVLERQLGVLTIIVSQMAALLPAATQIALIGEVCYDAKAVKVGDAG